MSNLDSIDSAKEFYSFLSMGKTSNFEESEIFKKSIANVNLGFSLLNENKKKFTDTTRRN